MRRNGSLKSKNTWVRKPEGIEGEAVVMELQRPAATQPPAALSPLRKVGRFKLVSAAATAPARPLLPTRNPPSKPKSNNLTWINPDIKKEEPAPPRAASPPPPPKSKETRLGRIQNAAIKTKATPQQKAQRAMKLLRLGGNTYAVSSKGKGRNKTLRLQSETRPSTSALAAGDAQIQPPRASKPKPAPKPPQKPQYRNTIKTPKGTRIRYCPVYCQTGRCPERNNGCPYLHDTTKRAICARWLESKCSQSDTTCPLQHVKRPELLPSCVHFLYGRCTKGDACPYLHSTLVRVTAPHCSSFLSGYCSKGVLCRKKHYTLKQIKQERRLAAGAKRKKRLQRKETSTKDTDERERIEKIVKNKKKRSRYFDDCEQMEGSTDGGGGESESEEEAESSDEEEEGEEEIVQPQVKRRRGRSSIGPNSPPDFIHF